ncbi:MAG: transcriptional regulator [Clostridiales bacterium]|nr:transcriptional regulator [Clostridiales bacterium]MCF8021260.1 transcriptional regulator [Clostridiales bacterium]
MTFAEKLDLLMNITNTSNSVLARNISMDASFISRLRRGVRTPARNADYLKVMAAYFARNCRAEYQKTALWGTIKSSAKVQPQETAAMEELIYKWLKEEDEDKPECINKFLTDVSHIQFKKHEPAAPVDFDKQNYKALSEVEMFYGVEGKQKAVLAFLSLVLQNKKPQTLFLYSDEDMGWLTENRRFTLKWSNRLAEVIRNGNKIKIIHTVNRNLDEMLTAVKEWVPMYMTGNIEPYYYPRNRDGLFRRTLFIAPDTAAVTSCSVGSEIKNAANFLFTNSNTIKALFEEYNNLLAYCRRLMRIFTPFCNDNYLSLLAEFEEKEKDTIVKTDALTTITMPPDVWERILARIEIPDKDHLLSYHQTRIKKFLSSLQKYKFNEIISLPETDKILAGDIVVNFSDILKESLAFYTHEEYRQHLQNIIQLLKNYNNYHVYLTSDRPLEGSMIYVREDVGVLFGKTLPPSVVFALNESNMTAAFWDYTNQLISNKSRCNMDRNHTIAVLEAAVAKLK